VKNIFEVLKQKEAALQQLQIEVEVLRRAVAMLSEEGDPPREPRPLPQAVNETKPKPVTEMSSPRQFP